MTRNNVLTFHLCVLVITSNRQLMKTVTMLNKINYGNQIEHRID